jgi:hypothetical protein
MEGHLLLITNTGRHGNDFTYYSRMLLAEATKEKTMIQAVQPPTGDIPTG